MKKAISLILAILMVVTAMPVAFAADETHVHSMSTDCSKTDGEQLVFRPIEVTNGQNNFFGSGNFYLTEDLRMSLVFYDDVKLCLNGHNMGCITAYGNVEICDCKGGAVTDTIFVNQDATVNMFGGNIINNSFYESTQCVEVERGGIFNFYGGSMFSETYAMRVFGTANIYCGNIVCSNFAEYDMVNAEINIECDYEQCDHICHKSDYFSMWIWFFVNALNAIFGIKQTCKCGVTHYQK